MGPLRVGAGEGKPDAKGANSKELPRPSESLHARYLAGVLIPALPSALLVPSVKLSVNRVLLGIDNLPGIECWPPRSITWAEEAAAASYGTVK